MARMAMMVLCVMVVVAPYAEAAISCSSVVTKLAPCGGYLSKGGDPSPGCCSGVKGVLALAKTTPDKQAICVCLKSAAKGVNAGYAGSLPRKCGVSIPYKISPSTDCSKIH